MEKYKLIFSGQIKADKKKDVLGKFLCKFLSISESNVEKLFSGRSFALRSNLGKKQVYDLQEKLESAGILTKVIREQQLEEDFAYQDAPQFLAANQENLISTNYKMKVGDRIICRHCGSHLDMKGADQAVPDKQDIFPEIQQIEEGVKFLTQATEEIANGATIENSVDRFPVSARWKNRFHIMESAGIRELGFWAFWKNLKKSVPYRKRLSINVPFPEVFFAALFGPLVYFYFKMPKKAILLITAQAIFGLLINVPFIMTGHVLPSGVSIGLNISFVVCTLSYDYYMKNYKGEEIWRFLPSIFSSYWFLVSLMLGSISAILALFVFIL